ncbi:MAG: thiol-disulfide oxidoreductase [Acidobacteria bacterium]|nr:MAG: thiol-disulfide oxidoreductase [Acidobacteriota bacterium]PIE89132.1 MAG: thiol-disulfide oxidoreductase [Acidobacteriota bacterium]
MKKGSGKKATMNDVTKKQLNKENIILFDGVCKLCNGWSRFIIKRDKKKIFKLAALQSSSGQTLLKHYNLPTHQLSTLYCIEKGNVQSQSDAVIAVFRQLPFPFSLFTITRFIPKRLRDGLYRFIAKKRYAMFGQLDSCPIPNQQHQDRFLP